MMKRYLLLLVMPILSFSSVNTSLAEERCTTKQGTYVGLTSESLVDFFQLKSQNNQEGSKKLIKERKIFSLPKRLTVELKGQQANGFYNFAIPALKFEGWVLKEDLDCVELVDIPNLDYFPLKVGNMWDYKIVNYRNNKKQERTIQKQITDKIENADGSTTFIKDGKPYIYRYKEAIVAQNGMTLMKLPLKHGARWESKGKHTGARMMLVKDAGFTFDLNGISYQKCIRIIAKSEYHALMKEQGVEYTAFENQSVYAPNVGLLQTDSYRILRDGGKRTHTASKKLVSFKTNQPIAPAKNKVSPHQDKVKIVNSFRFPETQFIHPYLSPNEKWLTYFKSDTIWEELYFTAANRAEKHIVPVFPDDSDQIKERKSIGSMRWSPAGNILAVEVELGYDEHISLIDFSSETPKLLETIRGVKPVYVKSTGELLYLDKLGNIEKKEPGAQPEHLVFTRSSFRERNEVTKFQVAIDGTILYSTGHPRNQSVYLTSLQNPGKKTLLYINSKKAETGVGRIELSATYDLSPNGKYALFYTHKGNDPTTDSALLFDLTSHKIVTKISVRERAVWSPDGDMLAYLEKSLVKIDKDNPAKTVRTNPHFFIYNLSTGEKTDFGIGVFGNFNWIPDSTHIIYSGKYDHETIARVEQGIFLIDINGIEVGKISSISSSNSPVISTSGKYIIWGSWEYSTFFIAPNPYQKLIK